MPKDNLALSVKHIADIEKGLKNPSFVILQSLARVLNFSLDNLIWDNPNTEEHDLNERKASYYSCPPEMRKLFLSSTQGLVKTTR